MVVLGTKLVRGLREKNTSAGTFTTFFTMSELHTKRAKSLLLSGRSRIF
jgi:hypothetical protein